MILTKIFDRIMDLKGDFTVLEFQIGKQKKDHSRARLQVMGKSRHHLSQLLSEIYSYGAVAAEPQHVLLRAAQRNMVLPDGFYSTTNNPTFVNLEGEWIEVEDQMMDKAIVVQPLRKSASCVMPRNVKKGDLIVVGDVGVKVVLPERPRRGTDLFEFMSSRASSEKPMSTLAEKLARDIVDTRRQKGKIVVVAGPAVVHTGASDHLASLIHRGYVNCILSGNALAVHDVENALYGTSLGIIIKEGVPQAGGHRNHIAALNEVFKAGSLRKMAEKKMLRKGIFYECVKHQVPFILAASIRDDGPLPDVLTDVMQAQTAYKSELRDATLVIMLSTLLHSVAVGNMLPSDVKIAAVDINPASVTKLVDRGTGQAIGIVSDVGTFLPLLLRSLDRIEGQASKGLRYLCPPP
jgi:lysine-ketoglutarate reductase/saccharopine dehydrogenase-like protein (TIGR00300 family)